MSKAARVLKKNIATYVKLMSVEQNIKDGEKIGLPVKELGNSEIYPQSLQHSPNGRYCARCV